MQSTLKKQQPNNFLLNSSFSTPNLYNQSFLPMKNQKTPCPADLDILSNIEAILNVIVYPCCGQNMVKLLPSKQIQPFRLMYIMPCGHSVCHKCVSTILENIPNPMISCSNSDCTERYTLKQAETKFVKNLLISSFVQKLWKIKLQQESLIKNETQNAAQINQIKPKIPESKPPQFQSQVFRNANQMEVEADGNEKKERSEGSSEEETFHECTNIFCKKPTLGFFCSVKCWDFQNKLDGTIVHLLKRQKNEKERELII